MTLANLNPDPEDAISVPVGGTRRRVSDCEKWKALALELGDALAESLQHPDHVSDEVRKERNRHALRLLTRLDASRSLDWWGDSDAPARMDGAR